MAKGDAQRAQNMINRQEVTGQNALNRMGSNFYDANRTFGANYAMGSGMNLNSYDDIMRNYSSMFQNPFNPQTGGGGGGFGGGGGGGGQDYQSQFMQMAGPDLTPQRLIQMEGQLGQQGIQVLRNAAGVAGKIRLPNGQIVDVIRSAGLGGGTGATQWDTGMGGGGQEFGGGPAYDIYRQLAEGGGGYGWDPEFRGALSRAIGGYGNFAETGGFSDQDLQDIRARAISPVRSVYSRMQSELGRNRALQPFSPNFAAASAKMAREQSYNIADMMQNANAGIAQMVQQGKLAGLGGLTGAGLGGQGASTNIDSLNARMKLAGLEGLQGYDFAGLQARLGALGGMTNLYGTTPGLANTFGNQVLQSQQNLLGLGGLQNQLAGTLIGGQLGRAQIPGNWQQAMSNIGAGLGIGGRILGGIMGAFPGMGGMPSIGSFGQNIPVSSLGGGIRG